MNKVLSYWIFCLIFFALSCNHKNDSSSFTSNPSASDSTPNDTVRPPTDYLSGPGNSWENFISVNPKLLPTGSVIPFTGKMYLEDIPKYRFILDTLARTNDSLSRIYYNKIYGYTQRGFFIYNCIFPEKTEGVLKYYAFSHDTIIVPFRFDIDQEETLLTRWRKSDSDTLEYLDYFITPLGTKNASLEVLYVTKPGKNRFIIGNTHFGEGGKYGEDIWLASILNENRLNVHYLTSCQGQSNSDTLVTLQYDKIKDGIKVYKASYQRDHETGLSKKLPLSKKLLGTFMYKDYGE